MKRMKRIIISVLALGVCLTPLTVPLMVQPSWGQSENPQVLKLLLLLILQAKEHQQKEQYQQAIETLQEIIPISRQIQNTTIELWALSAMGFNYNQIAKYQEALDYYNQSLTIAKKMEIRILKLLFWIMLVKFIIR